MSASTHMRSVAVCGCPSAHTGRLWLSVCHTHDVCGCPSVHISARCTHRTSVGVRQHTQHVCGCPWLSGAVRQDTQDVCGCPCVSVGVHQHTQDVCGCMSAHTGRPCVSVSIHWTSMAVHQYTYQHAGPWTQHAGPSCGLFGDFGPRGLSVQYTQDVRGLLTLPVDCSGHFSPRGLSVQYTQYVSGCPPAQTGHPWLSVCVRVCLSMSVSAHRTSVAVHQYTYQHIGPWTQHAGPSRGLFGTSVAVRQHTHDVRGSLCVSVCVRQHTQDVSGCPPAHTGRPWLSLCVRVCPSVSVSTHMTSMAVHHTHRTSAGVRQHKQDIRVCPCVSVCVRQHTQDFTQDIRGCLPAHTGRPWLSVSTHLTYVAVRVCLCVSVSTHRTLVGVRQHTQDVRGCPCVSVCVRQHTHDVHGCPSVHILALHTGRLWVSASTHKTSVAVCGCPRLSVSTHRTSVAVRVCLCVSVGVRQHTQDIRGCPSAHTGCPCVSICVLGLSLPALPVDCSGDFSPCGLSVQYTQDVRGCLPAHTRHPWLYVCLSVFVSTHRTSAAVHQTSVDVRQHTQEVRGCLWQSASTHRTSVAVHVCTCVSVSIHMMSVGVRQHTQDVRGCPCVCMCVHLCPTHKMSVPVHQYTYQHVVHTGRLWVSASTHKTSVAVCGCPRLSVSTHRTSVAVRVCPCVSVCVCGCPPAHTGRLWLSVSTHRMSVCVLGLSMPALPVDCSGDFGPCGLSVQYTQDVRGCLPAHTGRPWLSVCYTQDIRGCPPAYTGGSWLSVAVRQHTQDVRGCPCVYVCVRQHTHDVRGCPPAHTGRPWLSVCSTDHYMEQAQHGVQDVLNISTEVHVFHRARLDLDHARLEKDHARLEKDHLRLEKDHARLDLDHEVSQNDRDFSVLARLAHTARTGNHTDGLIYPFDQFTHFDEPSFTKARILHLSEDIGHTWSSLVHDPDMVAHTDSPTSVLLLTAVPASGYNEPGQKPIKLVLSFLVSHIQVNTSSNRWSCESYQAKTRYPSLGGLVIDIKHHLESGISKAFPQPSCDPSIHPVLHPEFISKSDPFE
ncbi:hypothetical protein YC2023_066280 [Brassica napus]